MSERDADAIEAAVRLDPAYLGVIASRKRFAQLRQRLLERGVASAALDRVVAPAGLDIGARTPEEIALSIMAHMVERRRSAASASEENQSLDAAELPREAVDPVCGMTVSIAGARHTTEVGGRRYYFCCAGCRTTFLADSSRYVAARAATGAS
jgi:xanthine dehydrogenase accessory factor